MTMNGIKTPGDTELHHSAIGYPYDDNDGQLIEPWSKPIDKDLPYKQPPGLNIPKDIILPTTMKSHAIIEKTAKFIATQGTQMEMILKSKQSNNNNFNFLTYNNPLNQYYKYLVNAIKTNTYPPAQFLDSQDTPNKEDCNGSKQDLEDSYLHPSLVSKVESAPPVPSIAYKPTSYSVYAMLVSKIKGNISAQPSPQLINQVPTESTKSGLNGQMGIDNSAEIPHSEDGVSRSKPQQEIPSILDSLLIERITYSMVQRGPDFESLVKTKDDPRLAFLEPTHKYHWHYLNCKKKCKAENKHRKKCRPNSVAVANCVVPLSAAGIPIANQASFLSRPATLPSEVVSRIEQLKKRNHLFNKSNDKLSTSSTANFDSNTPIAATLTSFTITSDQTSSTSSLTAATPQIINNSGIRPKRKFTTSPCPFFKSKDSTENGEKAVDIEANSESFMCNKKSKTQLAINPNSGSTGTVELNREEASKMEECKKKEGLIMLSIMEMTQGESVPAALSVSKPDEEDCLSEAESVLSTSKHSKRGRSKTRWSQ